MAESAESTEVMKSDSSDSSTIINHLVCCKDVYFKSQQIDEDDLSENEKKCIVLDVFAKSKSRFLARFGKHLLEEHLDYFKQFVSDEQDGYAVDYYLTDLKRFFSCGKRNKDVKNRRYDALKKLVEDSDYFSETEMMRRNPLLYHQLVGQYLSEDEKKKRDNIDTKNITFVNLLLESIDRDWTKKRQKQQQDDEDDVMEEEEDSDQDDKMKISSPSDSDSDVLRTKWGEFDFQPKTETFHQFKFNFLEEKPQSEVVMITATERKLLKEEFISIMYQNFLDGKDVDFDYSTVDYNDDYDNLDLKTLDAEESYFDSETPEAEEDFTQENSKKSDSSEDELDVFMERLNSHHSVQKLTKDIKKL